MGSHAVAGRGEVHDTGGIALCDQREESVGQHEMTDVIDADLHLQTVIGDLPRTPREGDARIVHEQVEVIESPVEFFGAAADRGEARQVEVDPFDFFLIGTVSDFREGRFASLWVTAGDDDLRTLASECDPCVR